MTAPPPLLEGLLTEAGLRVPAPEGVAALARDRLARVREARLRLHQPEDLEALHDFRVALRRLRSLVRAYRPAVRGFIGPKLRGRLRRISRASNASRDLEVKLAWLADRRPELRPRDQVGLRWLSRRLEEARVEADVRTRREIERRLEPLVAELEHRLDELAGSGGPDRPSLARVTGERLGRLLDAFENRLAAVRTIQDQGRAHRARIAGKRVRYLLEPLAGAVPGAAELVARFKGLQDRLGEMHDADVLAGAVAGAMEDAAAERGRRVAERVRGGGALDPAALRRDRRRDPMPGLLALAGLVQTRKERSWEEVEKEWLPAREALLLDARGIVDRLTSVSVEGIEIERKFLLREFPPHARGVLPLEIDQGYLPGLKIQERIRRVREGEAVRWFRTLKDGTGLVRSEVEEETAEAVFEAMWPLTEGRRIRKRRYRLAESGFRWELDEFTDRELVLAEVELDTPERVVPLPDWLAPHVEREVTEEPEFFNVNLAQ